MEQWVHQRVSQGCSRDAAKGCSEGRSESSQGGSMNCRRPGHDDATLKRANEQMQNMHVPGLAMHTMRTCLTTISTLPMKSTASVTVYSLGGCLPLDEPHSAVCKSTLQHRTHNSTNYHQSQVCDYRQEYDKCLYLPGAACCWEPRRAATSHPLRL